MHVSQTMLDTPPFTHTVTGVELGDLDINKFNSINNTTINSFSDVCYKKFKDRYPRCPYGSVDADPRVWTTVAIMNLSRKIQIQIQNQLQSEIFTFPNGCCTSNHCSINLFYELVVEELLKEKKIINTDETIEKMYGEEVPESSAKLT